MTLDENDEHLEIAKRTFEKPPDSFNAKHFSKMYQGGAVTFPELKPFLNFLIDNGKSSSLLASITNISNVG